MRDEDLVETVTSVLLAVWRFEKFTESRWLTVGSSTRVLVRGVLLGLDAFYQHLQQGGQHFKHRVYTRIALFPCCSVCV